MHISGEHGLTEMSLIVSGSAPCSKMTLFGIKSSSSVSELVTYFSRSSSMVVGLSLLVSVVVVPVISCASYCRSGSS